ncbi:hypothetical protein CYMTET_51340 [Cymbomonas tetramitiformis]|uniref:Uncharacterized protein n=1 Tax=Cymbomonas tetramitiformis TaxID=36881 RepID=A0AAE0BL92_9CHLO|nr:hypothetical protein CYMTET_51340 [Cymbomonas tetramitiformis]
MPKAYKRREMIKSPDSGPAYDSDSPDDNDMTVMTAMPTMTTMPVMAGICHWSWGWPADGLRLLVGESSDEDGADGADDTVYEKGTKIVVCRQVFHQEAPVIVNDKQEHLSVLVLNNSAMMRIDDVDVAPRKKRQKP